MFRTYSQAEKQLIAILALTQVGIVTFGTLFVMAGHRFRTAQATASERTDRISHFVREFGFLVLLIPLVWFALALVIDRKATQPIPRAALFASGIVLVLLGLWVYAGATRSMFITEIHGMYSS